tara:strand:+ start:463 stop:1164 length:702 start_codon:yes stop_codon:yes gene_type:complete
MPISHDLKIIFIHIPKTGGGTIEKSLGVFGEDNNGSLRVNYDILYGKENDKLLQHFTLQNIKIIKQNEFNKYRTISFVRNPYDRMVSEYLWRTQIYGMKKIEFKRYIFEEVIPRKNGSNVFVKNFYKDESLVALMDIHYLDQYKFLINKYENIDIDFIGKFENLEEDFFKIFNFKITENKIHKSKSNYLYYLYKKLIPAPLKRKAYRRFYDNETRDLIEKEYFKDLKYFNYNF